MTTLIDRIAGIDLGSPLETVFAARTEARAQVELCYQLLLHPAEPGPVSLLERHAVAAFVAAMHDQAETRDHYRALLQRTDADAGHTANIVLWEAENTRAAGPYGHFPKGPLSVEDRDGPAYRVSKERGAELGVRLAAALEQSHC